MVQEKAQDLQEQSFASAEGFAEYLELTGKDRIPEHLKLDAVYVFTLTKDAQHEAVEVAVDLYKKGRTKKIIINDASTETGYCGVDFVNQLVRAAGVPEGDIVVITTKGSLNTKTETDPLITYCKENNIQNIAVASAPFHYRRAFVSAVTQVIEQGQDQHVNIWPAKSLPKDYNWKKEKSHSQGSLKGSGIALTQTEMDRMYGYTENKSLKPWEDIKRYVEARDRRVEL